jgi:hypothetical protein
MSSASSPHLANDDAVRAHTQGVDDQLPRFTAPLPRRWADASRADHVLLMKLQFGRVLDGCNALVFADETGHHVQERRLAGAGAALIRQLSRAARSDRGSRASAASSRVCHQVLALQAPSGNGD